MWHRAISQKVAGSIPDGVIGIFHCHNPSGRTMAPGVDSASNRNEYQEYSLGCRVGRCVALTTLAVSCVDCLEIWEPQPPGTFRVSPGLSPLCSADATNMFRGVQLCKNKAVPLLAWSGPEGSRKLRFTDFMTKAQDGSKVVSLTHRSPLPTGNTPGTHFC